MIAVYSALFAMSAISNLPVLSPVFSDHMVLQRDKEVRLWGWADASGRVSIELVGPKGKVTAEAKAKPGARWSASLPAQAAGGPYTLRVNQTKLKDILFGDVWLCSGQSNMEMGITQIKNAKKEVAEANHPNIRIFTADKSATLTRQNLPVGKWAVCSPKSIVESGWGGFSAVGYFFGREIQKEVGVPIGLINVSWGGSLAEAWTSTDALTTLPDFSEAVTATRNRKKTGAATTNQMVEAWAKKNDPGTQARYQAPDANTSDWKAFQGPTDIAGMGLPGAKSVVWLQHKFEVTANQTGKQGNFTPGTTDGYGDFWINGRYVGSSPSVLAWTTHPIPADLLRTGTNTLTMRLIDRTWNGGITSGPDNTKIYLNGATPVSMAGTWKVKETAKLAALPALPPIIDNNPNWVGNIQNGMLNPFFPLGLKGVLWYQGESNVGRAAQYQKLLPLMFADWEKRFKQKLPCLVVQLANYGERHKEPVDDAWAEMRLAQARAAVSRKNGGYVVTHDIGEAKDIHPKNKQDVGKRLALVALDKVYKKKVEAYGPQLKSIKPFKNDLVLEFNHGAGLQLKKAAHSGFAIAGKDGKFVWAKAQVKGTKIVLNSAKVSNPTRVRYAWDSDPVVTLYNAAGLPAGPFEASLP